MSGLARLVMREQCTALRTKEKFIGTEYTDRDEREKDVRKIVRDKWAMGKEKSRTNALLRS